MGANLKGEFLRLLREDEEFRLAVMGLLGFSDLKSSVDRLVEAVNKLVRLAEAHEERLVKLEERITRIEAAIEELTKIVKAHEERLAKVEDRLTRLETVVEKLANAVSVHSMRLDSFDRRLMALGARWGVESEEAFRNAMKGIVEGILGVARVSKWVYFDKDGVVYGYPSQVDVDVVIKDSTHILVEVKSSVSRGDVSEFSRVGRLYEMVTGIKPRLVMVTPFIDDRGLEAART
ncbi:MAG: hypothetical protein AT714_04645, partial [Vulcanisaeta sp. OSP_8]